MTDYPDIVPKAVLELRADSGVSAIVGKRVRGFEPQGATTTYPGDERGPGEYVAFVVVVQLDAPRLAPRVPLQRPVLLARCYGRTHEEAAALRWAVSNAWHLKGGRTAADGLHIYQSLEESGGEQERDPDTGQPLQTATLTAIASTLAVAS